MTANALVRIWRKENQIADIMKQKLKSKFGLLKMHPRAPPAGFVFFVIDLFAARGQSLSHPEIPSITPIYFTYGVSVIMTLSLVSAVIQVISEVNLEYFKVNSE